MPDINTGFAEQMALSGKLIKENRIKKDMSQFRLAQLCFMQKSSISKLEAGMSNPTTFTLYKISVALEVPINHFF